MIEAGATGLEPAASGVTGRRSNQLNYAPALGGSEFSRWPRVRQPAGGRSPARRIPSRAEAAAYVARTPSRRNDMLNGTLTGPASYQE
jgi:hypothetical protein